MEAEGEAGTADSPRHRWANLKIRLGRVAGWRRSALLGGLGVAAAMALPPVYGLPLLIPAFVGLLWAVETSPGPGRAFSAGWWFGFGHFAAGLAWISFAFLVDAPRYGWLAPFAVAGMAAGMALFPAAAAILSYLVFKRRLTALGRVLVFGALWMLAEWLRGWVLTGVPWNLLGTVWVFSDAMIQLAALTGVYGLSLLTVMRDQVSKFSSLGNGQLPGSAPVITHDHHPHEDHDQHEDDGKLNQGKPWLGLGDHSFIFRLEISLAVPDPPSLRSEPSEMISKV